MGTAQIQSLKENLKEKLNKSGWDRVLAGFINSEHFDTLMTRLEEENSKEGITPSLKQVFNAFYECPFNDLKVVILAQDPYPKKGVADGLAFSCSNTMYAQPSLKVMFKEISEKVYNENIEDNKDLYHPNLRRWANQGILLLNTALTTTPGKTGKHYDIWKPFSEYLLKQLSEMNTGVIYVFMGGAAKEWARKIPESNYKILCYHPASAVYNGGHWNSNDVFNKVNQILESNNGTKIIW